MSHASEKEREGKRWKGTLLMASSCYIAGHYVRSTLALCACEIASDGREAPARTKTFNKIDQFLTKWPAQMTRGVAIAPQLSIEWIFITKKTGFAGT